MVFKLDKPIRVRIKFDKQIQVGYIYRGSLISNSRLLSYQQLGCVKPLRYAKLLTI